MSHQLPPAAVIPARIRVFLDRPHHASVGTTGEDGAPHQAIAWYRLDPDERILLNSRIGRRWPTDLLRDPRTALAVMDGADASHWVGLSGVVETVIDDVETARDDICALAVRYDDADPESTAAFRSQERISFRIRVTAVHDHLGDE